MNHFSILRFNQLASTNEYALNLIKQGRAQNYLVIQADLQTKGRGRQDRDWQSPLGNLYFSLILQEVDLGRVTNYSFLVACVIGEVLRYFGVRTQYKWPNDMMLGDKKLSGILLQFERINQVDNLVIGVGLNLVSCPHYAICLQDVGVHILADEFLQKFEEVFMQYQQQYQQFGFAVILRQWKEHAFKLGCEVTLSSGQTGVFEDVDEEGNLVLLGGDGQRFVSGVAEIL